jgi:F0F1-type ATP synthase membrane subunit a
MTLILFDIVQQFDFYEFIKDVRDDPSFWAGRFLIASIVLFIFGWFFIPCKYSGYYWFKKLFLIIVKYSLKEKFDKNHFANSSAIGFYIIAVFVFYENLEGLVPKAWTFTAWFALPAHLAATFFVMALLIAWHQEKFKWTAGFYVIGIPAYIIVALWLIEFSSYCMRLLSLTLRLFINLAAGHLLLKAFVGIVYIILFWGIMDGFGITVKTWGAFILDITFYVLEIIACMLQAVVMASLIAIHLDHSIRFVH